MNFHLLSSIASSAATSSMPSFSSLSTDLWYAIISTLHHGGHSALESWGFSCREHRAWESMKSACILYSEHLGDGLEYVWLDGKARTLQQIAGIIPSFIQQLTMCNVLACCQVWFVCNAAEQYTCTDIERSWHFLVSEQAGTAVLGDSQYIQK